jgi:hypothetical protein
MKQLHNVRGLFVGVVVVASLTVLGETPYAAAQTTGSGMLVFGPSFEGPVTQKFAFNGQSRDYIIEVNGVPHEVPEAFYHEVQVGTIVRFDGLSWTVLSNRRM